MVKDLKSRQPHRPPSRTRLSVQPVDPVRAPAAEAAARTPPPMAAAPSASPAAAAAPAQAATAQSPARNALAGLSFTRLFGDRGGRVAEVELLVRERSYGMAVRRAAEGVTSVLTGLNVPEQGTAGRAVLLGLDGREYLRLARLATQPDGTLTERDALFALYLLVSAMLKADAI